MADVNKRHATSRCLSPGTMKLPSLWPWCLRNPSVSYAIRITFIHASYIGANLGIHFSSKEFREMTHWFWPLSWSVWKCAKDRRLQICPDETAGYVLVTGRSPQELWFPGPLLGPELHMQPQVCQSTSHQVVNQPSSVSLASLVSLYIIIYSNHHKPVWTILKQNHQQHKRCQPSSSVSISEA